MPKNYIAQAALTPKTCDTRDLPGQPGNRIMKTIIKSVMTALTAFVLAVGLMGCATSHPSETKNPTATALACPQCKTVTLGSFPSSGAWRGEPPDMVTKHACEGCKGIVTLVPGSDGFRHECSVCKQSPFSCKVTNTP